MSGGLGRKQLIVEPKGKISLKGGSTKLPLLTADRSHLIPVHKNRLLLLYINCSHLIPVDKNKSFQQKEQFGDLILARCR